MTVPGLITKKEKKAEQADDSEVSYYTEMLENKLRELICAAEGVGSARVVLTLDGTGEYVYAKNEKTSDSSYAADYVIVTAENGGSTVLLTEIYPKIRGVAIVCDGGGSDEVKKRVTELVSCALGISANKIAVSG